MKKSITPNQIKENNRNLIYQYIYQNEKVSQQDIAYDLRLSRPTVTTNLTELEEDGLITKNGQMYSEYVGRKAVAYSIVPDYRIAIGVEILRNVIKIIAVDLYGKKIKRTVFEIAFNITDDYFRQVCEQILIFIKDIDARDEQILGIGFAVQGLVSPDHQSIIYGKILDCTGLSITAFTKYLPYTCSFVHDADSAAISELWMSPELNNAFFLSISKHLGASMIINRELLSGKHGHSSTIEHIQMDPNGEICYCGNRGCIETFCSLSALLGIGNDVEIDSNMAADSDMETSSDKAAGSDMETSLETFFAKLHKNDEKTKKRWQEYLCNLAKAINMLHLIYDTDFILGGYLTPYLCEKDIAFIHEEIRKITPFPETQDFLHISKMPKHNFTIGAALPYIKQFLEFPV